MARLKTRLRTAWRFGALLAVVLFVGGCSIGPKYQTPTALTPPAYKELTPEQATEIVGWQPAQPSDAVIHGQWWELFNDLELNSLEEQVNQSNQNIAAAAASFLSARALVKAARAQYDPIVTTNPAITNQRVPPTGGAALPQGRSFTDYSLPFDASWQPDLWGRIRNTVIVNSSQAQASSADLENVRLTVHAELAVDYFQLRGQDALKQLLDSTVLAYQQSLDLTQALYDTGIDSDESVAQAETQLKSTQALVINLGILRAQYEHAIALLVGQPASTFSLPVEALHTPPPAIPFGVPSQILERRPDIAAAERVVSAANAQIGIAQAAYYPTLTLDGSVGLASSAIGSWFTWPARLWSVGPSLAETIFEGGLRKANIMQFRANYDQDVANYRQTVLTAFQQVEDNLSTLRILSQELQQQDMAVQSAERNLGLATDRYRLGIDPYLNVITAQTTLLGNQQTAQNLRIQQMTASVQLIEALGGGWDRTQLPSPSQVAGR